jgi:hypothetical protein
VIEIRIDDNAQQILANLKEFQARGMSLAIVKALNAQNQLTISHIVRDRMSATPAAGKYKGMKQSSANVAAHVLGRRTGTGGKSINPGGGAYITSDGAEATIGTNLGYIRAHEIGFIGSVPVRGHMRQIEGRLRFSAFAKRKRRMASRSVPVRGHSRNVNIPGRHMIEWGIKDDVPFYSVSLSMAIREAFTKGGTS